MARSNKDEVEHEDDEETESLKDFIVGDSEEEDTDYEEEGEEEEDGEEGEETEREDGEEETEREDGGEETEKEEEVDTSLVLPEGSKRVRKAPTRYFDTYVANSKSYKNMLLADVGDEVFEALEDEDVDNDTEYSSSGEEEEEDEEEEDEDDESEESTPKPPTPPKRVAKRRKKD